MSADTPRISTSQLESGDNFMSLTPGTINVKLNESIQYLPRILTDHRISSTMTYLKKLKLKREYTRKLQFDAPNATIKSSALNISVFYTNSSRYNSERFRCGLFGPLLRQCANAGVKMCARAARLQQIY